MTRTSKPAKSPPLPRETNPPEPSSANIPALSPETAPARRCNPETARQLERSCRLCGRALAGFVNPLTGTVLAPALCPACEAEEQERREQVKLAAREEQRRQRQQQIRELMAGAGVPPRYLDCSLENYTGWKPQGRPTALLGPCGTGKTHLAVAYLREWIIAHGSTGAWFQRAGTLVRQLRQSCSASAFEPEDSLIRRLGQDQRFLVLDDLGAEALTDFTLQGIYDILDLRYSYTLPTVITSNLDVGQMAMSYGDRFMSRLLAMGEVVELSGEDYRLLLAENRQQREQNEKMH